MREFRAGDRARLTHDIKVPGGGVLRKGWTVNVIERHQGLLVPDHLRVEVQGGLVHERIVIDGVRDPDLEPYPSPVFDLTPSAHAAEAEAEVESRGLEMER